MAKSKKSARRKRLNNSLVTTLVFAVGGYLLYKAMYSNPTTTAPGSTATAPVLPPVKYPQVPVTQSGSAIARRVRHLTV